MFSLFFMHVPYFINQVPYSYYNMLERPHQSFYNLFEITLSFYFVVN